MKIRGREKIRRGTLSSRGGSRPARGRTVEAHLQPCTTGPPTPSARPAHVLRHVALAPTAPWLGTDSQGTCTRPIRAPENHGGLKPSRPLEIPQKHHRGPCTCHLGKSLCDEHSAKHFTSIDSCQHSTGLRTATVRSVINPTVQMSKRRLVVCQTPHRKGERMQWWGHLTPPPHLPANQAGVRTQLARVQLPIADNYPTGFYGR